MLYVVIFFLLVSVYLYCLLGGADFGAGIIEVIARGSRKEKIRGLITKSMAPIWEANHMWLIIAVVILFNGFPSIYTRVSTSLFIPLVLLLIGIVLRGTAFTFRHYDAIKDYSQEIYSRVFAYSSLMVSFFFGVVTGSLVAGRITVTPLSFMEGYINPWFNLFSFAVGLFVCALFSFIASVYLIGDTKDDGIRKEFISKSKKANIATVISGALVFAASLIDKTGFTQLFLSNIYSIGLIILATVTLPFLWSALSRGKVWLSRFWAGAQLLFILAAFYVVYFPTIVILKDGTNLTLMNSNAPEITQAYLGWALVGGSLLIFPSLFYLLKIFKLGKV